ncbi:terminus macrodomain insulation protein YfbV [Alteromonas sp. a30]|uniref:terminus macrodomain insulation protein YfbV n=1 Tax=Alteromonas sp. a30 TaxID=2730917 RepID=UPI00227E9F87|nr:terminus macrodomain insulation protein YfbV [Alteromonas sp. a30]MCY7293969.1 DUF412 domain-containing protein [Alteromonas sp. a30]
MSQSFASMVKDGHVYMKDWPMKKELQSIFPENRVISATRFGLRWMPPSAVISATVMLQVNGSEYLPQAIAIAAFFLSLPFQGLLWLGHRSKQSLPPSIRAWYHEIHAKMREQGCEVAVNRSVPRYRELALLLKKAFKELDRAFTKNWF